MSDVTRLLNAITAGDRRATGTLLPIVYDELRRMAAAKMSHEAPDHSLGATALVHEAYLRLFGKGAEPKWENQRHFFVAAAQAMQRVLLDHARRKHRQKRGGDCQRIDLSQIEPLALGSFGDILALNEALADLAAEDPDKADLVKLRFFAGLSEVEVARALGISRATVVRHWAYARAWLYQHMRASETPTPA